MVLSNYLIFISFFAALIGAYTLRRSRRDKKNISFAMVCFGIACWIAGLYLIQETQVFYWPDKLSIYGGFLVVAGLYVFSSVFPTEMDRRFDIHAPWKNNFYILLSPLFLLALLAPFNVFIKGEVFNGGSFSPVNGPLFPFFTLVEVVYVVLTVKNFYLQYATNIGYKRQRIFYVISGFAFFIVCAVIFDDILPAFGITSLKFVGPLSSVVFFIFGMFSIVSYNLFDIRLVLKSVLVYTASAILAIASLVGAYHSRFAPRLFNYPNFILTFFATIVLFFVILDLFNIALRKYLLKNYLNFKDAFEELDAVLHEKTTFEDIILAANDYFKKGLRLSWVYYFDAKTRGVTFAKDQNAITEGLITLEQIQNEELNIFAAEAHSPKFFYGAELPPYTKISNSPIALLPVWEQEGFRGYFLLGPQRKLSGLSAEEKHELQSAWAHLETSLARARLHQHLEHQVAAQVEDITYKNKLLKEMLKGRLDFVQLASHQLRTPITTMSGYLQLLLKQQTSAEQREMVQAAYDKSKNLTDIVENILRLARIESMPEPDTNERVDLGQVFNDILPIVEAAARPKNLYISYLSPQVPIYVAGNKTYLEQAFFNLLENAVQYTREGGIIITFENSADSMLVRIEDSGVGITPEFKDEIFKKHVRTKDSKGIGLGLYIVKAIIDSHRESKIWFESGQKGTTFFVSLPKYHKDSAIINA